MMKDSATVHNNDASTRIIMLSSQFMPEVFGGAEQQCLKLSKKLIDAQYKVTVLTSRINKKITGNGDVDGVPVVRLLSWGPPQLLTPAYLHAAVIWFFKTVYWLIKNKNTFDIIHMHQAKYNAFVGLFAARILKKRAIIKIGNSGKGFDLLTVKRKPLVGKLLYNYIIKSNDIAIAISKDIERELLEAGIPQENILFIPNGVNMLVSAPPGTMQKQQSRTNLQLPPSGKMFLFIGRLEKQKDVLLLVESFTAAKPVENNLVLVLVGDGDLRPQLEKAISDYNINERVILVGYQKNVFKYILAADFFVLSTQSEGLSNALLEAMSAGLIPISTAVSGSVDLIEPNVNGYLTKLGSAASLTQAIEKAAILTDEQLHQFSSISFNRILTGYEMNYIASRYVQLYKTLLK
jgi:glycosyltransferase involved in cell wall biosynthesis